MPSLVLCFTYGEVKAWRGQRPLSALSQSLGHDSNTGLLTTNKALFLSSQLPINFWSQFSKQFYPEQGIAGDFRKNWQTSPGKHLPNWPRPALLLCSLFSALQSQFWVTYV